MTIFSPQKFHRKAKNPRKRPIVSKFVVPKVRAGGLSGWAAANREDTCGLAGARLELSVCSRAWSKKKCVCP